VISAILVAIGWRLIVLGKREAHQRTMMFAAAAAIIFFIIYLTRTAVFGSTPFGGPDSVKPFYLVFLLFHIVLAMVSAVMGIVTLTLGYKKKYFKHKKIDRPMAIIWFITAITGVTVYVLLYVAYPVQDTTNLWDAIFGLHR